MDAGSVKEEIIKYNIQFPFDRLWRQKYTIPLNSPGHLGTSFFDQYLDIMEDKIFDELKNQELYEPNTGNWLKPQDSKLTLEQEIEKFNKDFSVDD
jgi:hypothetical protein